MPDSIGGLSDSELLQIAENLYAVIEASPGTYGLTVGFATTLDGTNSKFSSDLAAHAAAQSAAKAATATKSATRVGLEQMLRDARQLAKAAKISEADYLQMGLPSQSSAAPPNATVPLAIVDTSRRLQHTISFWDAGAAENKRRPRGVVGAEIWVKIGPPEPGNEKDCQFLGLDTRTPYTAEYEPSDAGKLAFYMLRWVFREGGVSPWGETVSATITA